MQEAQSFAAAAFALVGLSHLFAGRAWAELFRDLAARGAAGSFVNAALQLPVGLVLALYHPVWSGPGLLLTIVGWASLAKGALYLFLPGTGARLLLRSSERAGPWSYRAAGVMHLALAGYAGWLAAGAPTP